MCALVVLSACLLGAGWVFQVTGKLQDRCLDFGRRFCNFSVTFLLPFCVPWGTLWDAVGRFFRAAFAALALSDCLPWATVAGCVTAFLNGCFCIKSFLHPLPPLLVLVFSVLWRLCLRIHFHSLEWLACTDSLR